MLLIHLKHVCPVYKGFPLELVNRSDFQGIIWMSHSQLEVKVTVQVFSLDLKLILTTIVILSNKQ